jgi:hypothetical protein
VTGQAFGVYFENYDPQRFASLYAEVGPKLRQFFDSSVIVALLEGSVKLRRPAVEAIEERLFEYAKEEVQNQRVRQLVGHMISHLMEELGYELDQPEVRLPSGVLFTCGARYRAANNASLRRRHVSEACSGDSMTDATPEAEAQRRQYPIPRPPLEQGDPRFTVGLLLAVGAALQAHGYPSVKNGRDLVELQQALLGFIYGNPEAR